MKVNNNKSLNVVLNDKLCPSSLAIRTYGNIVESINQLKMLLKSNNMYCGIITISTISEYETQAENSLDNDEIIMFNTKDNWINFIENNTKINKCLLIGSRGLSIHVMQLYQSLNIYPIIS